MNTLTGVEGFDQGTSIHNSKAVRVAVDGPRSALLEEESGEALFSSFFGATWTDQPLAPELEFATEQQDFLSTEVLTNRRSRIKYSVRPATVQAEPRPAESANIDRVTLLARKYIFTDKFSEEDLARLAILTERVRKLMPSVTARDFEPIEGVLRLVEELGLADSELRALVNLNPGTHG